jgi:3-oxoadipate enol-lactonase
MPVLSANGETINYVKEGAGPAVALIHSLGSSVHMWRDVIAALKDRYTLIACDARGHGNSSGKDECSVATMAADLKSVLDHLGIAQCHLVGISTGGPVALTLNAQSPGLARTLVLAGTAARPVDGSKERVEATAEAIAYVSMEEFGTQYAAQTLLPSAPLPVQDELAGAISKMNPKIYNQLMRSALLSDFTALLPAVKVPVLVLTGEHEAMELAAAAESLAQDIPGATRDVVPGAGHLGCLDNPSAFSAALAKFLDAHRK